MWIVRLIVGRILKTAACLGWLFNCIFRLLAILWLQRFKLIYRAKDNMYPILMFLSDDVVVNCILAFPSFKTLAFCAVLCVDIRSTTISCSLVTKTILVLFIVYTSKSSEHYQLKIETLCNINWLEMAGNSNQDWIPALSLLYRKLNGNGVCR